MPRRARAVVDGGVYHVITRGNNSQTVFQEPADYQRYLSLVRHYARTRALTLHHYALLPEQAHLVLGISEGATLSKAMLGINLSYTLFYRKRYQYYGHLWRGRFASLPLDGARGLLERGRAVELIPVRLKLAQRPGDYPWSSYRTYAEGAANPLLGAHPGYDALGGSPGERQHHYRQFVQEGLAMPPPDFLLGRRPSRRSRAARMGLLTASALLMNVLLGVAPAAAQSSNGTYTVFQEDVSSGGGRVGGGNPLSAVTASGHPAGGVSANSAVTIRGGYPTAAIPLPDGARAITVQGDVDESCASATVNGLPATLTGSSFQADGVPITEGANAITAITTDLAGNSSSDTIIVYLDTHPPARPTAGTPPAFTTGAGYTLTGTKSAGTSIWINGVEVVPLDDAASWSATVSLAEGDNLLVIFAKDAAGNASTTSTVMIVLDNLPPVLTASAPEKTNFEQAAVSGSVDDSLTAVSVNGVAAARSGLSFTASVPLSLGVNLLTVTATSPAGWVSTQTLSVIRGTIPVITAVQPAQAAKLYAEAPVTLEATATDQEGDPIEYRFLLDGTLLADWSPSASASWTPATDELGPRALAAEVRDAFGGSRVQEADVYVVRKPIVPP